MTEPPAPTETRSTLGARSSGSGGGGRRFAVCLALIALAGFTFRLGYVVEARHDPIGNDGSYYHSASLLLTDGAGFVLEEPFRRSGKVVPRAIHPPAWPLVLAAPALVAAGIAAVYPFFWRYERELMSETLALFGVAALLFLAYRFWARPSLGRAVAVAVVCGLLALTRAELVLLVIGLLAPLVLLAPAIPWRRRAGWCRCPPAQKDAAVPDARVCDHRRGCGHDNLGIDALSSSGRGVPRVARRRGTRRNPALPTAGCRGTDIQSDRTGAGVLTSLFGEWRSRRRSGETLPA